MLTFLSLLIRIDLPFQLVAFGVSIAALFFKLIVIREKEGRVRHIFRGFGMQTAVCVALATLVTAAESGPSKWPRVWSSPPVGTPSKTWPGGPILGNGNIGISVGGAIGLAQLYFSTHGFYSVAPWAPVGPVPAEQSTLQRPRFPDCPSPNCTIPVGLVLGNIELSSPSRKC
jgi:hypothetical protein